MQMLRQSWWAPLAALLMFTQLWVAAAFVYGDGTSNILDAESSFAGISLSLVGAGLLGAGLWTRPTRPTLGSVLIVAGAGLAAIWLWIIFMTPVAVVVIIGVLVSQMRSATPAPRLQ